MQAFFVFNRGKSQPMKFTAPIAMPMPKMIPANMRLDSPSPKAKHQILANDDRKRDSRPRAIGPVNEA